MKLLTHLGLFFAFTFSSMAFATENSEDCSPYVYSSRYMWIDSVSINDTLIKSEQNAGYFKHAGTVAALHPGQNTMTLAPGHFRNSYKYETWWRGWLDRNGNGRYEAEEMLFEFSGIREKTVKFTVPDSLKNKKASLRIMMNYGSYPEPCERLYHGEVEDFSVLIKEKAGDNAQNDLIVLDEESEVLNTDSH